MHNMECFDLLPKEIRKVLHTTYTNVDPRIILQYFYANGHKMTLDLVNGLTKDTFYYKKDSTLTDFIEGMLN